MLASPNPETARADAAFLPDSPADAGVSARGDADDLERLALAANRGGDADTLLRNADAAMYAAKAEGGDCVRVFAESTVRGAAR